jgi:hypothetical protein
MLLFSWIIVGVERRLYDTKVSHSLVREENRRKKKKKKRLYQNSKWKKPPSTKIFAKVNTLGHSHRYSNHRSLRMMHYGSGA